MRIGAHTIEPATVLAPMASITNPPFRQVCLEAGVGLAVTEMLSAEQLTHPRAPVLVERCPSEQVLVVQIFGRSPLQMARAAQIVVDHGADVVDLNMGCPAKKVIHQGAGVAIMREPELASMITEAVVGAVDVPVTVKMRSGYHAGEANAPQVARLVVAAGARAVTVHARTRTAVHTGPVDHEVIRRVRDCLPPEVAVIGNGAVAGAASAAELVAATGCDGVMVGRGARGNPWVFQSIAAGRDIRPKGEELSRMILRHLDLYVEWGGERRAMLEMRKHLCWYLRGMRNAAKLRGRLGGLKRRADIVELVRELV